MQKQIDQIAQRMDQGFQRLEDLLRAYEERTRSIETREAACAPILTSKIDAAWRKLNDHESAIDALNKIVLDISQTNKILKWLLGVFTAILTALLIGIAIGQIQLVTLP